MLQKYSSGQGLQCLLAGVSMENAIKVKNPKETLQTCETRPNTVELQWLEH